MKGNLADIRCLSCKAPAKYDILKGTYRCSYCDKEVALSEAVAQKQGFRALQQQKIQQSATSYRLIKGNCTSCGASLIMEEGEAIANCPYCGVALVRKDYAASQDMPEMIIPFRITPSEASSILKAWCSRNPRKRESRHLKDIMDDIQGSYLPYELIKGPVACKVSRMDASAQYQCQGYVDNVFVNCSKQLNNLLLDATEPYELNDLSEFNFGYVAGQRIKTADVSPDELSRRIDEEVSSDYSPVVQKTLETKAVHVSTDPSSVLRMPVLLPVYYVRKGMTLAAINGQTGKVAVQAEKPSYHVFLPWWLKAILSTILICGIAYASFRWFGLEQAAVLYITGMLGVFTIIVTLAAFSDSIHTNFLEKMPTRIFTSQKDPYRRINDTLEQDETPIAKEITEPVFFATIDNQKQPVKYVFTSPMRVLQTIVLSLVALFFPVILALFINGFNFSLLDLRGSAVWFAIMVPVVPIYILKLDVIDRYERPWTYVMKEDGSFHRYHRKPSFKSLSNAFKTILQALVIPPVCFATWFAILSLCIMVYLTAFGLGD